MKQDKQLEPWQQILWALIFLSPAYVVGGWMFAKLVSLIF